MRRRVFILFLLFQAITLGVIIDRIAVVVGNSIVKDSDIDRDIRVTDFLNGDKLDLSTAARKKAASRLVDQVFIRHEIRLGEYPAATLQDADKQLADLKKQRFKSEAAYQEALARYGITELELRTEFQWQLTVLRFIDARFRPAVLVSEDDIQKYYQEHAAALRRQYPGKSLDDLKDNIRDILTGEKVNEQFFSWLDEQRKDSKIQYLEGTLA